MLTAIVVVSMSLASFANNANTLQVNSNGISIENADPHTKQFEDMKKILDEYEQAVKEAKSCEDLDTALMAMAFKFMALTENSYDEEVTPKEEKEIGEQMNRLDVEVKKLEQQWGCSHEGDGGEE